jgi:2-haloacid dehalogenase
MNAYLALATFPEVPAALDRLAGRPRAILSNGSPRMLAAVVHAAGLEGRFARVISVDEVKIYKPAPVVYALGPKHLGIPARELLFVSSNAWDVAGAKSFGYQVAWCNRPGAPREELGAVADHEIASLDQLPL